MVIFAVWKLSSPNFCQLDNLQCDCSSTSSEPHFSYFHDGKFVNKHFTRMGQMNTLFSQGNRDMLNRVGKWHDELAWEILTWNWQPMTTLNKLMFTKSCCKMYFMCKGHGILHTGDTQKGKSCPKGNLHAWNVQHDKQTPLLTGLFL